jgi:hypothetical protein
VKHAGIAVAKHGELFAWALTFYQRLCVMVADASH